MKARIYVYVTGVFFGLVGIAQFIRAFFRLPIHLAALEIPVWPSWIASAVTLGLCVWAFSIVRSQGHKGGSGA